MLDLIKSLGIDAVTVKFGKLINQNEIYFLIFFYLSKSFDSEAIVAGNFPISASHAIVKEKGE